MNSTENALALGVIAGVGVTMLFVSLIMVLLLVIAHWRMFTKAGEKGWKALIPVYSEYIQFKIAWSPRAFWTYLVLILVMTVAMAFSGEYAVVNGRLMIVGEPNFIMGLLQFIASIGVLFYTVMLAVRTAAAFGKGTMFALGLALLPMIFGMILGFGSSQYRGPQE